MFMVFHYPIAINACHALGTIGTYCTCQSIQLFISMPDREFRLKVMIMNRILRNLACHFCLTMLLAEHHRSPHIADWPYESSMFSFRKVIDTIHIPGQACVLKVWSSANVLLAGEYVSEMANRRERERARKEPNSNNKIFRWNYLISRIWITELSTHALCGCCALCLV